MEMETTVSDLTEKKLYRMPVQLKLKRLEIKRQ